MSGNDYSSGLYGYSIIKSVDLIRRAKTLENAINLIVEEKEEKIATIMKKKTRDSEKNQKDIATCRKLMVQYREFETFYNQGILEVIDKRKYEIKWPA